jgi:hypothetical protein
MNRAIDSGENSFVSVLIKLIPSEVIAVFIFIQGVMPHRLAPHLIAALILLAITPVYLNRVMGVRSRAQLVISTLSLVVWIYAMRGGPVQFIRSPYYEPWYGAAALALWTLIPPMFLSKPGSWESEDSRKTPAASSSSRSAGRAGGKNAHRRRTAE